MMNSDQFEAQVEAFKWTGRVTEFHVHHVATPKAQWQGAASVQAIRDYHVKTRGYRDTAQHVTLGPDGSIWPGRDWNLAPASATGHNGHDNGDRPFMVEIFADFTKDELEDPQRGALVRMIAAILNRFSLPSSAIRFHREMQGTECPGNIDREWLVAAVQTWRTKGPNGRSEASLLEAGR